MVRLRQAGERTKIRITLVCHASPASPAPAAPPLQGCRAVGRLGEERAREAAMQATSEVRVPRVSLGGGPPCQSLSSTPQTNHFDSARVCSYSLGRPQQGEESWQGHRGSPLAFMRGLKLACTNQACVFQVRSSSRFCGP